jgi:hypothetical protein
VGGVGAVSVGVASNSNSSSTTTGVDKSMTGSVGMRGRDTACRKGDSPGVTRGAPLWDRTAESA